MTGAARPAWWPRVVRLGRTPVAAALVALALVLGIGAPASAHAELVSTDPAEGAVLDTAPEVVTLTFNESVRLTAQEVVVYDAEGAPVPSSTTANGTEVRVTLAEPPTLGDGTYVVAWNVLSGDGHPVAGALTFSVGAPSATVVGPPEPETSSVVVTTLRDLLAAIALVGLLVAAGLALFSALVLPTTWTGAVVRARLRGLLRATAGAAAVAVVLQVPVAAVYGQGLELGDVATAFDPGLLVNETAAAALVVLGLATVVRGAGTTPPDRRHRLLLAGGALVALAGPSLVGHTRAYAPVPLLVAADVLHLLAGATWLGGLVGLVLSLRALAGREVLAATTLARFSTLAGGTLLAVAATGTFLAWRVAGSWSVLVESRWGWLLLVKVALALAAASLGGWNRWRTLPAVRRAVGFGDRELAAAAVTRTVRVEAALLVVLLGVTGVMTGASPRPAPVVPEPGTTGTGASVAGDLRVLAVMSPQQPGTNTLLVQLQDAAGDPVDPPTTPVVVLRTDGLDVGEVTVTPIAAGTWRGQVVVPRPGTWEVQVSIELSRFDNPVTTVRLTVPR